MGVLKQRNIEVEESVYAALDELAKANGISVGIQLIRLMKLPAELNTLRVLIAHPQMSCQEREEKDKQIEWLKNQVEAAIGERSNCITKEGIESVKARMTGPGTVWNLTEEQVAMIHQQVNEPRLRKVTDELRIDLDDIAAVKHEHSIKPSGFGIGFRIIQDNFYNVYLKNGKKIQLVETTGEKLLAFLAAEGVAE
jgi:hypothetical protein